MRRRVGIAVLATVVVGAAVLIVVRSGGAQVVGPAGKPIRVAVVNVKQVSDTCKRTFDLRADLEKQREARLLEVDAIRARLRSATKDLDALKRGSLAWEQQRVKAAELEVKVRVLADVSVKLIQAKNLEYTTRIYEAIIKEIDAYARSQAIDLVLRVAETDLESRSLQELYQKTALRSVYYAAPALDITEAIRRAVDRAYQQEKEGGATP